MLIELLMMAAAQGAPAKLPPVDQCSRDPGFKAFHSSLKSAVTKRDGDAFLKLLAPDVLVNFGGENGKAAFAKQWEVKSRTSPLWAQMDTVLRLGCARVDSARVMPSLAGQFDSDDDVDVFELSVVTAPGAKLRKSHDIDGATIATLAWDVVRPIASEGEAWTKVRLNDGREGWLRADELRSPLDYRAVAEKRKGRWMITAFVAGD
jgi:hypothetical protein